MTAATIAAALVGLAGGLSSAAEIETSTAETELSDEQLAMLCPEIDHLIADDLPEGVELPELREACEWWSAETPADSAETPADADEFAADEPSSAEPGSTAASEPGAVTNASPTAQPGLPAQPASPAQRSPTTPSPTTPSPASPATAVPGAPPTSPSPPTEVEPRPPATVAPGSPPAELFRADLPPAALLRLPLPAVPEFGLFGYQSERRPADLEAAGSATALPTESPQLPLPIVLATILLATVGTALVRSGASSASRDK